MKSVQLVVGDSREVIYLVPDYDRDGDVNFLVLPKNDFVSDSVTDEINFYMIDGCEPSGAITLTPGIDAPTQRFTVKWEVL